MMLEGNAPPTHSRRKAEAGLLDSNPTDESVEGTTGTMIMNESEPDFPAAPIRSTPGLEPQSPPTPARRNWRPRSIVIASAVAAVVIVSGATGIVATARFVSLRAQAATSIPSGGSAMLLPERTGPGSSGSESLSRAGASTSPSAATATQSSGVVLIDTTLGYESAQAAGTGIVLTSTGEILTNNHVIRGATSISVTVASTGMSYSANVVGTNVTSDIAVLQLAGASGLTTAAIDSSAAVAVAESVVAVGNAGGAGTLAAATGAVTAVNQTITAAGSSGSNAETLTGLIQTDATVVPGDSGGPLYYGAGGIVGIDTAASSGGRGVPGFAIPIASALNIATQIESGVTSSQITLGSPAFLGVSILRSVPGSAISGSPVSGAAGAVVSGVVPGTPAASAGLVAGDTITAVDSTAIGTGSRLSAMLASRAPGDSVTISWTDAAGATHSTSVTLIAGPAN